MSDTIRIDGDLYTVASLSNEAKNAINLIRLAQEKRGAIIADLQIAEASINGLSSMLSKAIADTDPVPEPEINTGSKEEVASDE